MVQHQRGKEVVGAHVGELGALLVDRSPTKHSASLDVVLSSARERVVKLEAALAALGDACGPEVVLLQSSLKSAKRAAQEPALDVQLSQCEQFVARAQKRLAAHDKERVRLASELQEGESRFARLREAAAVARDVPVPQPVQPHPGVQVSRLEEMVKVLQNERDSWPHVQGVVPSPGQPLAIVNIGPDKTRELTNALFQEDGDRVARLSSALATIGQDQRGAERFDRARREKKSSVERTNHIHGGQQGQLSKRLFCFEDRWFEVVRGKKDHDVGPLRRAGWRGVSPRTALTAHVKTNRRERRDPQDTQVDEDSDAQRSRRGGRRVSSDSDVPLVRGSRFAVLTESDDESDPLIRPTGQTRNEDDVNTFPASSGAVAAHLGAISGDARQVEFDMTFLDADTESLSTHSARQIEHQVQNNTSSRIRWFALRQVLRSW